MLQNEGRIYSNRIDSKRQSGLQFIFCDTVYNVVITWFNLSLDKRNHVLRGDYRPCCRYVQFNLPVVDHQTSHIINNTRRVTSKNFVITQSKHSE